MLEMWLSKERLLSNSTPRFLTVDEELTKQPSSFRQCSRLLHAEVLGQIIKGIVHPKMKILSLITHPHVVPNP